MRKVTEETSLHRHLEKMSTIELVTGINQEDKKVANAVELVLPKVAALIDELHKKMKDGGRLFYIGAGTSGRLGVVDASECPPTFGVPHEWVVGLIAGGDEAIRKSIEFAEDDVDLCWKDLNEHGINDGDFVVGIAASGTTPYVVNGLKECRANGIKTGCITCNEGSPMATHANHPIEVVVGPEFLTGSTRMKSGTAQKLVLNMITTGVMIKLGRVVDNKMVDMQISNNKLVDRATKMILNKFDLTYEEANKILLEEGSVREAIKSLEERT